MKLSFYTRNPRKVALLRGLLAERGVTAEVVQAEPPPEIQADTCEQVVVHTLRGAQSGVAEDSGLFIPALGGFPGVITAHVQERLRPEHLLRLMRGRRREAVFRSAAGVALSGEVRVFTGEMHGVIAPRPLGKSEHWLDTLFIPRGETRSLAEMSEAERFEVSDWKQSFTALADYLAHTLSP